MPPQRKKAKTSYVEPDSNQAHVTDPTLHPDLAAASTPIKIDPAVLHPDLAAASTPLGPTPQPANLLLTIRLCSLRNQPRRRNRERTLPLRVALLQLLPLSYNSSNNSSNNNKSNRSNHSRHNKLNTMKRSGRTRRKC